MKKRLVSLALALLLILGVMPMALAAEGETTDCGHNNWGDWEQTTAPTCVAKGEKTRSCQTEGCGAKETQDVEIDPNNHPSDKLTTLSTTATCIAAGTAKKKCSACEVTVENVPDAALGHYFSNGICTRADCQASFSISVSPAALAPGETGTITASAKDYKGIAVPDITFSSSAADVASVDGGTVKALKAGTADITAKATIDGAEVTVSCTVTVKAGEISCQNVTVKVGQSGALSPSLTESTVAASDVTWSFSTTNTDVITLNASTGAFTGRSAGTATVTITGKYTKGSQETTVTGSAYVSVYEEHDVKVKLKGTVVGSFDFADTGILDTIKYDGFELNTSTYTSLQSVLREDYASSIIVSEKLSSYGKIGTLSGGGSITSSSIGLTRMENIKFVLNGTSGSQTLDYTLYNQYGMIVAVGELTITTEGFDAAVEYSTYAGMPVTIKESDFAAYWKQCKMTGNLDYVEFAVSSTVPLYGTLYTTASASTRKAVSASMDFSYNFSSKTDNYDLNTVTYVPLSSTKVYEEEIPFTCYGEKSGQVLEGVMVIKVGLKANFTDVTSGDYFYDAVNWAVSNGITKGTSDTTFSPNLTCTRAEVVTFLWRAAGEPQPTISTTKFTDLDKDDYYYDAVLWAVEKGITEGTSATTFSPRATVTRGQVVTFLWRALGKTSVSSVNPFTDVKTSDYFCDAVLWAVKNDVTKGMSATSFMPNDGCTRGQIVTFLYRAYN